MFKQTKIFIKRLVGAVTAFTVFLFIMPFCGYEIEASASNFTNVQINDIVQEDGCLKSFKVSFDLAGGLADAPARISVNTQKFKNSYSDNIYGDFTDFGKYAETHNYADWPDTPADCGFVAWNTNGTFNRPGSGNVAVDVSLKDGQISVNENKTYYIYLWANYGNKIYPDAYLCEFSPKGDRFELEIDSDSERYSATLDVTGVYAYLSKENNIKSNETITVTIKPLNGFISDTPTVSADNAAPGSVTAVGDGSYTCEISNFTDDTIITVIGTSAHTHSYSVSWNYDSASHWHECSCGKKADAGTHISDVGTVTVQPTAESTGVKAYSCTVCGYIIKTETIPAIVDEHTHEYSASWNYDSASHWHECSCGKKADTGTHISDGGTVTVQPTAESTGVKTYSCTVCGYIIKTETIPAAAEEHTHEYSSAWNYDSTAHWHECICGEKSDIGSHISNSGIVTVQPTYYSTGVRTYSCAVCGYVMHTETIPAIKQDYYPNHNPVYNDFNLFVNTVPGYTFEKIKLTGKIKGNSVVLSWTEIEDADEYTVYQSIDGKYKAIKTTADTAYTVENLATGKYKFIVRYTVDGRLSPISKAISLTADIKNSKPYPVATVKKNIVTIRWQAVDDAEKYAIYLVKDGRAKELRETDKKIVKYLLESGKEYQFIVRAYVDGKWTDMKTTDIITVQLFDFDD